jgi:hypothetical protein
MANKNPRDDGDAVSLTIPAEDAKFLRGAFEMARDGIRDELANYPDELEEPTRLHREEAVYDKLLAALDTGSIIPDRDVMDVLADLATVIDESNEHKRVVAEHAAIRKLREQIECLEVRP